MFEAWKLIQILGEVANQIFVSKPESTKKLEYALSNDPNMTRESVWAYTTALAIENGMLNPESHNLTETLEHLIFHYESFIASKALEHLNYLKYIDDELLLKTLNQIERNRKEYQEGWSDN